MYKYGFNRTHTGTPKQVLLLLLLVSWTGCSHLSLVFTLSLLISSAVLGLNLILGCQENRVLDFSYNVLNGAFGQSIFDSFPEFYITIQDGILL